MKQRPISFSLSPDNIQYVMESYPVKHRNKSHWLDDLITHLRAKPKEEVKKKLTRAKISTYPNNLEEQFNLLWLAKGTKSAKKKAFDSYRKIMKDSTNEVCQQLTEIFIAHIESMRDEIGFDKLHLVTYLNQERWES